MKTVVLILIIIICFIIGMVTGKKMRKKPDNIGILHIAKLSDGDIACYIEYLYEYENIINRKEAGVEIRYRDLSQNNQPL